jgi:hypothetical protein
MSKEFRTIGTNTDPLSVQLYFDENNSIKWRIIFKDAIILDQLQKNNQYQSQSNDKDVITVATTTQDSGILSIFDNIYVIGSKTKYQFKYNDIQLQIYETEPNEFEVEYSSFDHLKYNKIIGEDLEKNISWKHYLKTIRKDTDVNLNLNSIEISNINAFKEIIESAIADNQKECLIVIGNFSLNQTNISWFRKNKEKFEIKNSKILLFWSGNISEQIDGKKIGKIYNFKDPKAFVIKSQLYNDFLKKLNENKITWECCLYQLIEENQFDSYQIAPQIFY